MTFRDRIIAFVDAFNADDLDQVMDCFADDAEYVTLDGRRCTGRAAIRAEFTAQFEGRYGQLRFLRDLLIVDEQQQTAAVSWRCEHGLAAPSATPPLQLVQRALAWLAGPRPYWEGVDLFRFRDGKLVGKYTYGQTRLPRFRRS